MPNPKLTDHTPPRARVILGTSAVGKTAMVNALKDPRIIDGDDIIAWTGGWPFAPRWWADPILGPAVHLHHLYSIRDAIVKNQDITVLFCAPPELVGVVLEPVASIIAWTEDADLVASRLAERIDGNPSLTSLLTSDALQFQEDLVDCATSRGWARYHGSAAIEQLLGICYPDPSNS